MNYYYYYYYRKDKIRKKDNIKIDDKVVIKADKIITSKWQLAIMTEVNIGNDIVRVVTIQELNWTYLKNYTYVISRDKRKKDEPNNTRIITSSKSSQVIKKI